MPTASPKATAAATAAPQPEREQVAGGGHGGGAVGAGEVFLAGQGAPRGRGEGRRRPSEESINTSSPRQVWSKFWTKGTATSGGARRVLLCGVGRQRGFCVRF